MLCGRGAMHRPAAEHDIDEGPNPTFADRFRGKYVSLTSFKRDGTGVATPLWYVAEDERLLVLTSSRSFKVKRIRRNPNVTVAPCSAAGRPRAEPVWGRAELLPQSELHRVQQLMNHKYRADRIVILPLYRALQRLRGAGGEPADVVLAVSQLQSHERSPDLRPPGPSRRSGRPIR